MVVLDSADGVYQQDMWIASRVFESGAAVLLAFNKWDLVDPDEFDFKLFERFKEDKFRFLKHAPALRVSALTGSGTSNILPTAAKMSEELKKRIRTPALNKVLEDAVKNHTPPSFHGKEVKLYYATQLERRHPTFLLFSNDPTHVREEYRRYLVNRFREAFGFEGIKVSLVFRKKK